MVFEVESINIMKRLFVLTVLFCAPFVSAKDTPSVPELEIEELQENVYLHRSYKRVEKWGVVGSNGLLVINGQEAFIVDTPWTEKDTALLISWIDDNGYTLIGSISTHSHTDRSAGIGWLNERGIPTYATKQTNAILAQESKPQATHVIQNNPQMLAGGIVEAFYPGGGHTEDNIVVWLPHSEVLHGGCFVRTQGAQSLGYTGEARINEWPTSVDNVLSRYFKAKLVVPGHGAVGGLALLKHTKALAESSKK